MPEENIYAFNPAYAGLQSSLDITAWGREQWSGVTGRPSTQSLVAHMPAYRLNGGIGMRIANDRLGPFQYLKFELGYDYVQANENLIWSIGVTGGINRLGFDGDKLLAPEGTYTGGLIDHNDPRLPELQISSTSSVFSIGAYVITDAFEGGIALQDIHVGNATFSTDGKEFDWLPNMSATLYFEYGIEYGDLWYFYPDIFVKYDFRDIQTLVKVNALYQDVINGGIGLRGYSGNSFESIVISMGYAVDQHFSVYYSYDIGLGGLAREANGSHEIILRYNLNKQVGKGKTPKIINNPRYL